MLDLQSPFLLALKKKLEDLFKDSGASIVLERPPTLSKTPGKTPDVAIPCFSLAKSLRLAPPKIAEQIKNELSGSATELQIEDIQVVGGYVNLRFLPVVWTDLLTASLKKPLRHGASALSAEKIVVDFSSPNIAKPFSIGHLRSTNIGASICRIYEAQGAEVIRINHLGDWGTQFGKLITAYKHFGSAEFVKGDPINNLYKLYVEFHEKEREDPALLDEARQWFVRLEQGDEEAKELWTWFKDVSFQEFKRIYDRLGVKFDYITGESFYNRLMDASIDRLKEKKLLVESEGAEVVLLEEYGMPPCLIRKSDGSTLYATRDIATAEYRANSFQATQLVYVVGGEQRLHFKQFFKVLELMGYAWAKHCVHVDFGLIKFPEGKMSTRKGNIIRLEEVLDQAEAEARRVMDERRAQRGETGALSEAEKDEIARLVGTGAVKFFDLKARRNKDVHFDWKDILNFEGDSGPYLQYSAVRIQSLLDKAAAEGLTAKSLDIKSMETEEERELARELSVFPAILLQAAREYEPSIVSAYLLNLAAAFNRFYMNVPVLKAEAHLRESRLNLAALTRAQLVVGLELLGIRVPAKM